MFAWIRAVFGRKRPPQEEASIFPPIDAERVAADMELAKMGALRGGGNLPETEAGDFDEHELAIVNRVDGYRRQGLHRSSEHSRVYAERAGRATVVDADIRQAAAKAETDFQGALGPLKERVRNAHNLRLQSAAALDDFRRENRVLRTAHEGGGIAQWLAVALLILLVESVLNGVFFSKAHEMGFAGGVAVALGISVINVGVASVCGYVIRNFNHIRSWRKTVGVFVFLFVALFAAAFNAFVAYFRDAMTRAQVAWDQAAGEAIGHIAAGRLPDSIDSWLLALLGVLATILAGWKAYGADDPYPGYGRVWRDDRASQDGYLEEIDEVRDALTRIRDEAVNDLNMAHREAQRRLDDARRAARELAALPDRRAQFLEECDRKANALLTTYREANRKRRTSDPPAHFGKVFSFPPSSGGETPAPSGSFDGAAGEKLGEVVNGALDRINEACVQALASFEANGAARSGAQR